MGLDVLSDLASEPVVQLSEDISKERLGVFSEYVATDSNSAGVFPTIIEFSGNPARVFSYSFYFFPPKKLLAAPPTAPSMALNGSAAWFSC